MAIRVVCPKCAKVLAAPDNAAGKRARCSGCQNILTVPAPTESTPRAPASVRAPVPSPPPADDEYRIAAAPPPPPPPAPLRRATESPGSKSSSRALERQRVAARPSAGRPATAASAARSPLIDHEEGASSGTIRHYAYFLLAVALLPLVWSVVAQGDDIEARLRQTADANPDVFQQAEEGKVNLEVVFARLPGERLEGAHLARTSWVHWFYALLSAAAFLGLILLAFHNQEIKPLRVLLVGLCTATVGILFLFSVQWLAAATQGVWIRGNGIVLLIFYFVKFVGFSYNAASDPENGFLLSCIGFTFGVGLCEEFTKAMPVIVRARSEGDLSWRAACLWGLASGVGFGVAEGIMYSSRHYNGIATGDIYVVRFVSCVALHAIWAAAVALLIWHNQEKFYGETEWSDFLLAVLIVQGVPMVLHGLYDTMLKRNMELAALATALISFVYLAVLVEYTRRQQDAEPRTKRRAALAG